VKRESMEGRKGKEFEENEKKKVVPEILGTSFVNAGAGIVVIINIPFSTLITTTCHQPPPCSGGGGMRLRVTATTT